jgi:hypothetical protein
MDRTASLTSTLSTNVNALNPLLDALSVKYDLATTAQKSLNVAMSANKIGIVINGINVLVTLFSSLISWMDRHNEKSREQRKEAEELTKSIQENRDAHNARLKAIKSEITESKRLLDRIKELSGVENKSAEQKAELNAKTLLLAENTKGLNLAYDKQKDVLNMSVDSIDDYIGMLHEQLNVEEKLARALVIRGELETKGSLKEGALEKQIDAYRELAEAKAKQTKESEKLNLADRKDAYAALELIKGVDKAQRAYDKATTAVNSYAETIEGLNADYDDIITTIGNYTNSMENSNAAAEFMAAAKSKALESLAKEYVSLADTATDMFNRLCDASVLSAAEMTANLNENQRVVAKWAENIAELADKGIDAGLLETLRAAGPQAAGHVNALVEASEEELRELSEVFEHGGEVALQALATSLGLDISVAEEAANLAKSTADALVNALEAANIPNIGNSIADGLAEGIAERAKRAADAAREMGKDIMAEVIHHQHIQAVPLTPSQLADETRAAFIRAKWL